MGCLWELVGEVFGAARCLSKMSLEAGAALSYVLLSDLLGSTKQRLSSVCAAIRFAEGCQNTLHMSDVGFAAAVRFMLLRRIQLNEHQVKLVSNKSA